MINNKNDSSVNFLVGYYVAAVICYRQQQVQPIAVATSVFTRGSQFSQRII